MMYDVELKFLKAPGGIFSSDLIFHPPPSPPPKESINKGVRDKSEPKSQIRLFFPSLS